MVTIHAETIFLNRDSEKIGNGGHQPSSWLEET